jgi:hypothetical protein
MKLFWGIIVGFACTVFGLGWLLWWLAQPDSMGMTAIFIMLGSAVAIGALAVGLVVQIVVWVVSWYRK